jgi:1-acyl-sn-glycerol-3-phosphate acyltransferase
VKRYPPPGQLGPRAISEWGLRTQAARVAVEGREQVPAHGPVMLVARHFHHLLDGAVLVTRVARPIHIVVGLDWAATPVQRRWMERLCRAAEYPIVLRQPTLEHNGIYRRDELLRYTRSALRETTRLLRAGRVVLVFPEGYPNIDPAGTRKGDADDWLPFEPGFLKMIEIAERDGATKVALVPVGFAYERGRRWSIRARIGPPLAREGRDIATIEAAVRGLSRPAGAPQASAEPPHVKQKKQGPPPERRAGFT